MAEDGLDGAKVSSLIKRGRPLTAASCLVSGPAFSSAEFHYHNYKRKRRRENPFSDFQTLKPWCKPMFLVGTLTLPVFADCSVIKCSCFRFSDGTATVCCDILNFDLRMIDHKIKVLAWNFLPVKCTEKDVRGGFLEIIRWEFFHDLPLSSCGLVGYVALCSHSGAFEVVDDSNIGRTLFGVIESISPIFVAPCSRDKSGLTNIIGFLANILVCQCKLCISKICGSKLRYLNDEGVKGHSFVDEVIVYFYGLASSWHPAISRFISHAILLTGLRKKNVFLTKEVPQLMFVAGDLPLHLTVLFRKQDVVQRDGVKGKGESIAYSGLVTGIYMQGQVAELDKDVMLLLTDQLLNVPHSMRVGAIVTLKHSHLVDPQFPWRKMLILGVCCRTTLHVESFSPLETRCYLKSRFGCDLQKYIDSLNYSAKLWVLLIVSCLRKKFKGILSEMELLGSENKEGLAKRYACAHLPKSAYQTCRGPLAQFCKPDLGFVGKVTCCSNLRLVPPIATLINYFVATWKNILDDSENFPDPVAQFSNENSLPYNLSSCTQPVIRWMHAQETGVHIMGTLRFSSSGRMQLIDATGEIDIAFEVPAFHYMNRVYEAKDYKIILESMPYELKNMEFTSEKCFSCGSILGNAQPRKLIEMPGYIYCYEDSGSCSGLFGDKENFLEFEEGEFQLLLLTHKFPSRKKFKNVSNLSEVYAEAILLPWDLTVTGRCDLNMRKRCAPYDSTANFPAFKNCSTIQRFKSERDAADVCCCSSKDDKIEFGRAHASFSPCSTSRTVGSGFTPNSSLELPCSIVVKQSESCFFGSLLSNSSGCQPLRRRMLLHFPPDAFFIYAVLRIGVCYVVKLEEVGVPCPIKGNANVTRHKLFSSKTHIWSATFSSSETCKNFDSCGSVPICKAEASRKINMLGGRKQPKSSCLTRINAGSDILSDVTIYVAPCALSLLASATSMDSCIADQTDFSGEKPFISKVNTSLAQALETSSSNGPLLKGSLVTLSGAVVAFHHGNGDALPTGHGYVARDGFPRMFHENNDLCVLVLEDHTVVNIVCNLSKQAYPVGFGRGVHATFYRVLALGEQNKYMTIPASFISFKIPADESTSASESDAAAAASNSVSSLLIYDALKLAKHQRAQFCCRVVGVYVVVMEEARGTQVFQASMHAMPSAISIPLACFIIDDGSSRCCCWVDSEMAATLLKLDVKQDSTVVYGSSKGGQNLPCSSSSFLISQLKKILKEHRRVVAKNHELFSASSFQYLMFSAGPSASISCSHEEILSRFFSSASSLSKIWTIVGERIDQRTALVLDEKLADLGMPMPPMLNIRATSISQTDLLPQARNIIAELIAPNLTVGYKGLQ